MDRPVLKRVWLKILTVRDVFINEYRFRNSDSQSGLLNTIAWGLDGTITYALEGSVFVAGAGTDDLYGLQASENAEASETIANSTEDKDVYVVPAFAGLGTPYWDMYSRGYFGLTRDIGKNHL